MLLVFCLSYLAAFALYQGDSRRCALREHSIGTTDAIRATGYTLLLAAIATPVSTWGGERGIPTALVAISLAAPLSLLLASRWPQAHLASAPLALLVGAGGLAL